MSQVEVGVSGNTGANKGVAMAVYILQAVGFLLFITFIVGAVINYVKKGDVKGTWLESHFKWQLRTFWFGILWNVVGFLTLFFLVGYVVLAVNFIWMIYRVAKGLIRLLDEKPMYDTNPFVEVKVTVVNNQSQEPSAS